MPKDTLQDEHEVAPTVENPSEGDFEAEIIEGAKLSAEDVAKQALAGKWGRGQARKKKLEAAGYSYSEVRDAMKRIISGT